MRCALAFVLFTACSGGAASTQDPNVGPPTDMPDESGGCPPRLAADATLRVASRSGDAPTIEVHPYAPSQRGEVEIYALALDERGNHTIAGFVRGTSDLGDGVERSQQTFVASYAPNGPTRFVLAIGESSYGAPHALSVATEPGRDDVLVEGRIAPGPPVEIGTTTIGPDQAFSARLGPNGAVLDAHTLGASTDERAQDGAVGGAGTWSARCESGERCSLYRDTTLVATSETTLMQVVPALGSVFAFAYRPPYRGPAEVLGATIERGLVIAAIDPAADWRIVLDGDAVIDGVLVASVGDRAIAFLQLNTGSYHPHCGMPTPRYAIATLE